MGTAKLKRLRTLGWKVGDARDFLQLSDEESKLVDLELSLLDAAKQAQQKRRVKRVKRDA